MKQTKNTILFLIVALPTMALAQATAGYSSSESYTCCNGGGQGSEVTGTLNADSGVSVGSVSGNVVSPTVVNAGGGGPLPSVVPIAQMYGTTSYPYGEGGGYEPNATMTSTTTPEMPNTALGDDTTSFYIVLAALVLMFELGVLGYKFVKREEIGNKN